MSGSHEEWLARPGVWVTGSIIVLMDSLAGQRWGSLARNGYDSAGIEVLLENPSCLDGVRSFLMKAGIDWDFLTYTPHLKFISLS